MSSFLTHLKNKILEFFGLMTRYEADLMAVTAVIKSKNDSSDTYQMLAHAYNKLEKELKVQKAMTAAILSSSEATIITKDYDTALKEGYEIIAKTIEGKLFLEQIEKSFKSLVDIADKENQSYGDQLRAIRRLARLSHNYLLDLKNKK
jgi:hypothetical protein